MPDQNKKILTLGLGAAIKNDPEALKAFGDPDKDNLSGIVAVQAKEAEAVGLEMTRVTLDIEDWEGALKQLAEKLRSQHWDGFTIGFGFRGLKHYTAKFEDVVNLAREVTPSTKLGFPIGPDNVFETAQRMFPKAW